jgi:hypothetical protein
VPTTLLLTARPTAKFKNTFNAQKLAQSKKSSVLDSAPPVPQPQILPELARILVELPPAATEAVTSGKQRLLSGVGGMRPAHSAAVASRFIAVHVLDGLAISRVLSLTDYGRLFVHQRDESHAATDVTGVVVCRARRRRSAGFHCLSRVSAAAAWSDCWSVGQGRAGACACVRNNATLAYGGRSIDLKLRDLESGTITFHAKNQPPSASRLEQPVWVTGIGLHHTDERIVTVSGFCDLRIYDPRTQRRAIFATKFREGGALKAVTVSPDDLTYTISDNKGYVSLWCVRQQKELGGMKMAAGAQVASFYHPTKPLVATTGLDRFVHVYDRTNRRRAHGFYLKQRMTGVYLSHEDEPVELVVVNADPVEQRKVDRKRLASDTNTEWEEVDDENDEENDVWAQMAVAEEGDEEEEGEEEEGGG